MADPSPEEFDGIVEAVILALPPRWRRAVEEDVPVIVQDRPSPDMLADLGLRDDPDAGDEILGLHTGTMPTEASVDDPAAAPTVIHVFRIGLTEYVRAPDGTVDRLALAEEIRTTVLHELGHYFGLDEDHLADLGYD
ncbi:MAG: metallopeptidase family protein [Phycisphaerales bacterium]